MEDKEAMEQLRENLSSAKTQREVIEAFYAVTQSPVQNCAVADAAAALEALGKIRELVAESNDGDDCRIDTDLIRGLLEPKP